LKSSNKNGFATPQKRSEESGSNSSDDPEIIKPTSSRLTINAAHGDAGSDECESNTSKCSVGNVSWK
jgi:hypothetical protein